MHVAVSLCLCEKEQTLLCVLCARLLFFGRKGVSITAGVTPPENPGHQIRVSWQTSCGWPGIGARGPPYTGLFFGPCCCFAWLSLSARVPCGAGVTASVGLSLFSLSRSVPAARVRRFCFRYRAKPTGFPKPSCHKLKNRSYICTAAGAFSPFIFGRILF